LAGKEEIGNRSLMGKPVRYHSLENQGYVKNGSEEVVVEDVKCTEMTHVRSNGRLWY